MHFRTLLNGLITFNGDAVVLQEFYSVVCARGHHQKVSCHWVHYQSPSPASEVNWVCTRHCCLLRGQALAFYKGQDYFDTMMTGKCGRMRSTWLRRSTQAVRWTRMGRMRSSWRCGTYQLWEMLGPRWTIVESRYKERTTGP